AETLLESELFGHTKGSFTGAISSHEGLLSLCGRHGSIFLDEIGDISPSIQIKLLKVLEERAFTAVGSHTVERFHGRVIAATHQPLDILRKQGTFRDDFYYRLCSDCIALPSLYQRVQESPEELDILIVHTVTWITGHRNEDLCQTVRQVIDTRLGRDYAWPGNVRELAQCIRRVIIKQDYQGNQPSQAAVPATDALADQMRAGRLRAEDLVAQYCQILYKRLGTYEEVARRTDLDRRTVKRYVGMKTPGLKPER
ncbi:MAG: sigma-54-dependent Fis family transcriptional regulator, partial [Planctomycetes bacterium]|nr:sigma-54-dependent Fis family transcriptional regulator [Planctomycetota bacterium]